MISSAVIPDDAKDHFWTVVLRCLVEFHKIPRPTSQAKVRRFRKKVEGYPNGAIDLLYHNEPFDVACRIANHPISVKKFIKRYIEIRDIENPLNSDG